ncbi:MAG: type VI secretion system baseplate subunit TssF [Gemmatimonadetes bacterium]|nr:type VI secretion system baseplate subunit TssF [Gemmatimonadota bacterium]
MRDDLLYYYERELTFLRRTGVEFARRYPKVASRLLLEPNKSDDPHVERLLEGFAFLAARVHLKIDDDFPEISEALLNVVYPHYTRPIPSMSLVEFQLDPEQGKLTTGLRIPRESPLYSRPVGGVPCKFRTCYDTTLWPLTVAGARWMAPHELHPPIRAAQAVAALRLELRCLPDVTFAQLELETLRLHISAEASLASSLYELLCNNCVQILVRDPTPGSKKEPVLLPPSALHPVGFGEEEGMLPFSRRSFLGYRLLQEYFTFPDKFFFLDLSGFERVRAAGFGERAEVVFLISPFERGERRAMLEAGVTADTFRLGCTPIVNLFPQTSEPVLLNQRQHEYLVIPDARRRAAIGIFSVEEVVAVTPGVAEPLRFEPLYSFRHGTDESRKRVFWSATRRPSHWRPDEGTDIFLSFVDLSARPVYPDLDAVTVRLIGYNGDLPSRLPFGDPNGDFEMPGGGPIQKIVALVKPTAVVQPPLGKPQLWRLISQLSLNYMSLIHGGAGGLQELLRLHNFADSAGGEKQIQGILEVKGSPRYSRIESEHGLTFARGHLVEIDFDEEEFAGGSVYLLASVLERFLGLYVSLNSFSMLAARTRQRKQILKEWPPRAGWKTLL